MRNRTWVIAASVMLVAASAVLNLYFIRDDGAGQLLWQGNEAYLFVRRFRVGYRPSFLGFPFVMAREYFGGVPSPDETHVLLDVFRVTPSGVERHFLSPSNATTDASLYTPIDSAIYANCPSLGGLCRWAGDSFVPATQEERQRLGGFSCLSSGNIDQGANGWSRREFAAWLNTFTDTIDVGGQFQILIKAVGSETGPATVSIKVQRPGQAPEQIENIESNQGKRVSGKEYQRVFYDRN
jgi:hypothetical protein